MRLFMSLMYATVEEEPDLLHCIEGYMYMDCVAADISCVEEVLEVASSQGLPEIFVNTGIRGHGGSFPTSIKLFSM